MGFQKCTQEWQLQKMRAKIAGMRNPKNALQLKLKLVISNPVRTVPVDTRGKWFGYTRQFKFA